MGRSNQPARDTRLLDAEISDTLDLAGGRVKAFTVMVTGALKVTDYGGQNTFTITAIPVGEYHWGISRIWATGTDATEILGHDW